MAPGGKFGLKRLGVGWGILSVDALGLGKLSLGLLGGVKMERRCMKGGQRSALSHPSLISGSLIGCCMRCLCQHLLSPRLGTGVPSRLVVELSAPPDHLCVSSGVTPLKAAQPKAPEVLRQDRI